MWNDNKQKTCVQDMPVHMCVCLSVSDSDMNIQLIKYLHKTALRAEISIVGFNYGMDFLEGFSGFKVYC